MKNTSSSPLFRSVAPSASVRLLSVALLGCVAVSLNAQTQYTTGYSNAARTEDPGTLLSHPIANGSENIGRTTTLQYVNGWLFVGPEYPESKTGSDLRSRLYDISDPTNPVRKHPIDFGESYPGENPEDGGNWATGTYGLNAHGSAQSGDYLVPGSIRVQTFGGIPQRGGNYRGNPDVPIFSALFPSRYTTRAVMSGPWDASFPWYTPSDEDFVITKMIGESNAQGNGFQPKTLATYDHVGPFGGGAWHPIFFGDLLIYVRQNGSGDNGVVIYRLQYNNFEDPENMSVTPQLVGSLPAGFHGYWPNLFSDGNGLYVVGSTTDLIEVADITNAVDPTKDGSMSLVANYNKSGLGNATYPVYQDRFAFIDNVKVDMTKLIAGDTNPIALELNRDGHTLGNLNTSQMSLPLGNLWITGGIHNGGRKQGMAIWVQQKAPDTTKPEVTYHIPQVNRSGYSRFAPLSFMLHETPRNGGLRNGIDFTVRPVNANGTLGDFVPGFLIQDMSGIVTFNQDVPLAADTTYQVDFLSGDNGTPANLDDDIGFVDAAGNRMDAYTFRFSTGSAVNASPAPVVSAVAATSFQPTPGGSTSLTVNATGTGLQYRFNFEGTWSAWDSANTAAHSFANAGRYSVLIQVRNADGTVTTTTANILVITPPAGTPPTQSNTLALGTDSGNRRVWVVNPDSDTVAVLNAATGAKLAEYPVGKNPRSITRDSNGRYWVAVQGDDQIKLLNADGTVFQTIDTGYGSAPYGVAANAAGTSVFATYYGSGKVVRYTVPSGSTQVGGPVVSTTSVPTARAIAISGNGTRVFVTRFISPEYEGQVYEFQGTSSTLAIKRTISLEYDRTSDSGDRGAGVPNYLSGVAISPSGLHALVTYKKDNVQRGELFGVDDLVSQNTVRSVISVIDLTTNKEIYDARRDVDNSEGSSAVTFTPLGDRALIAQQGNNRIIGIDTLTLNAAAGGPAVLDFKIGTGLAPQGVLINPVDQRIYSQDFMGRSVTVFDASKLLGQNQTSLPKLATTGTVATELLSTMELLGKEIFYNAADPAMSAESYISCATCHIEGGHDGRVWDFTGRGEGLRRTTDLRGRAGTKHGNVHWSANFDEIQDFELDIRNAFGGTGFLPEGETPNSSGGAPNAGRSTELDALAAYVSSLNNAFIPKSPARNTDGTLTAAAISGKAVFESMSCVACHAGTKFTDSAVAPVASALLDDVGTISVVSGGRLGGALAGIDVPTLNGLHASSSYLHHGLAKTLSDVFTYAGGTLVEAEDATLLYTYKAPTIRTNNPVAGGGGGYRGSYAGKYVTLVTDTDQTNNASPDMGLSFTGIDGGSGGAARIGIRHAVNGGSADISFKVNGGTAQTVTLLKQLPDNSWRVGNWTWVYVDVNLAAGANNTIEIRRVGNRTMYIDAILVSTSADLAAANAHRQVLARTTTEQSDLLAYLAQLDGRDENGEVIPDIEPPETLSAVADRSTQGNDTSGTATTESVSLYAQYHVKFDLTSSAVPNQAILRIYRAASSRSLIFSAYERTDDWTESSAATNWNPTLIASAPVTTGGEWVEIDVTPYVQAQASGDQVVSFIIRTNYGGWTGVHSRENTVNPPELVLSY